MKLLFTGNQLPLGSGLLKEKYFEPSNELFKIHFAKGQDFLPFSHLLVSLSILIDKASKLKIVSH